MKAREIIELAERLNTFRPKEAKMPRRRGPPYKHTPDFDIAALLHKKLEEAEILKKILDDREKANKKEEKKEEKKGLSVPELAMILVATYPIIGAVLWMATHK